MSEGLVISGAVLHAVSGVPGLFYAREARGGQRLSVILAAIGTLLGLAGALLALFQPVASGGWFRVDGLAAIFLIPIFILPLLGGLYGLEYWDQAKHPGNGRRLRLFYGLVTAALAGVAVAAHALLFLIAWEVMALSAFFLVTTEDEDRAVRTAGWLYLMTTHISTLCLFALFALLHALTGSYQLGPLAAGLASSSQLGLLFLLAVAGFGCKAGLMPLHIWLPSAHAMTPSHVSALMSGVLIKIGIYGLLRLVSWLPDPPAWWGGSLLVLGVLSGVAGVALALGQHDLKRLLAYHSIENIGIIVMGAGLALVGRTCQSAEWVVLGLAGCLLHVWNHGLFKALLFLGAGSVIHATHTRDVDQLGGLARSLPRTAWLFALGAVAICGLPPLNGFVSELFLYLGGFRALGIGQQAAWPGATLIVPALALTGGLALACFVKAYGAVFLGQPRIQLAHPVREAGLCMTGPMGLLALLCLLIGVVPRIAVPVLDAAIKAWCPVFPVALPSVSAVAPLGWVALGAATLLVLLGVGWLILSRRIVAFPVRSGVTWDCGFAAPTARMQYTASSLAQILGGLLAWVQQTRLRGPRLVGPFPARARFHSQSVDPVLDAGLKPGFRMGARVLGSLRFIQAGHLHAYLLYIVLFLIVLLLWK